MKILTFKEINGHATNSSSSHSILKLKKDPGGVADVFLYHSKSHSKDGHGYEDTLQYGWEYFFLQTRESVFWYLMAQILGMGVYNTKEDFEMLSDFWKSKHVTPIIERVALQECGRNNVYEWLKKDWKKTKWDGYVYNKEIEVTVDHQSQLYAPKNFQQVKIEFSRFFANMLCEIMDSFIIIGGNDNSYDEDDDDNLLKTLRESGIETENDPMLLTWNCIRDSIYTFKDTINGALIVRSTGSLPERYSIIEYKTTEKVTPIIADMKITDKCTRQCEYCYQNSTPNGQHASIKEIKMAVDALCIAGVNEIAIGGGEPTLHPNIEEIIEYIYSKDMVPNISTRNIEFIANHILDDRIGGIGYSIDCFEDITNLVKRLPPSARFDASSESPSKITLHYILQDKKSMEVFAGIIQDLRNLPILNDAEVQKLEKLKKYSGRINLDLSKVNMMFNILFLKFKSFGRGIGLKYSITDKEFGKFLKDNKLTWDISIDTAMAKEHNKYLKKNFESHSYYIYEGLHSKYIDVVTKRIGPCSYAPEEQMNEYTHTQSAVELLQKKEQY